MDDWTEARRIQWSTLYSDNLNHTNLDSQSKTLVIVETSKYLYETKLLGEVSPFWSKSVENLSKSLYFQNFVSDDEALIEVTTLKYRYFRGSRAEEFWDWLTNSVSLPYWFEYCTKLDSVRYDGDLSVKIRTPNCLFARFDVNSCWKAEPDSRWQRRDSVSLILSSVSIRKLCIFSNTPPYLLM